MKSIDKIVAGALIVGSLATGVYACHRNERYETARTQRLLVVASEMERAPEMMVSFEGNNIDAQWRAKFGVPINSADGKGILYDLCTRNARACKDVPDSLTQPDYASPDDIPVQQLRANKTYVVGNYAEYVKPRLGDSDE